MSNEIEVKDQNTGLTTFDAEMAKYANAAAEDAAAIATGLPKFTAKAGTLYFNKEPVKGNRVNVVILDWMDVKTLYENEYVEGEVDSPTCWALGRVSHAPLKPDGGIAAPKHTECKTCPFNQFGSDPKPGRKGKACKDAVRLLYLAADDLTPAGIAKGMVAWQKVPVKSIAFWTRYVQALRAVKKRPPFACVTEVSVVPDPKDQLHVLFNHVGDLDEGQFAAIMQRKELEAKTLAFPFNAPAAESEEKPEQKSNQKARKYR
jgi:hypothetical protein